MAEELGIKVAVASYGCRFLIEAFLREGGFEDSFRACGGATCMGPGAQGKDTINIVTPDIVGTESSFGPLAQKYGIVVNKQNGHSVLGGYFDKSGASGKVVEINWLIEQGGFAKGISTRQARPLPTPPSRRRAARPPPTRSIRR